MAGFVECKLTVAVLRLSLIYQAAVSVFRLGCLPTPFTDAKPLPFFCQSKPSALTDVRGRRTNHSSDQILNNSVNGKKKQNQFKILESLTLII